MRGVQSPPRRGDRRVARALPPHLAPPFTNHSTFSPVIPMPREESGEGWAIPSPPQYQTRGRG